MPSLVTCLRMLAAAYLVGAMTVVSYWGAALLQRSAGPLARWCAVLVVGMTLSTIGFHVLLPLHLFTLPAALAAASLGLAAALAPLENRRLLREVIARDRRAVRLITRRFAASPHRIWIVAFAICALPALLRPFTTVPVSWDGVMYHLPKAAFWVQHGGGPALVLDPGVPSWLLTRNHLAGGEVFLAWAMLPMHADLYAGLPSLMQWLGLGLALVFLARQLGVREPFGTASAGFVLALAPLRLQIGSGYVELTLAITLALGLAFTLAYLRRGCIRSLLLAMAALGLACSVKIIALPVAGLALCFMLARAVTARRIGMLAAGLAIFVALASPWFVYNTIDTGAPLSPAPLRVAGIELGRDNAAIERIERIPSVVAYDWEKEWNAVATTFGVLSTPRESLGWPILVCFALLAVSLPMLARRCWYGALLVMLIFVANLVVVGSPSFTPWRQFMPESFSRFLLPAIIVAPPASAFWLSRSPGLLARIYFAFLLGIALFLLLRYTTVGVAQFELDGMLLIAGGVAGLATLAALLRRLRASAAARLATLLAAGFLLLAVVARDHMENRWNAARQSQFLHGLHRNWVDPAVLVDVPGESYTVAVTHGISDLVDTGLFYFLFGSELQNHLVHASVTRDGSPLFNPWRDVTRTSYESWLARIDELGADYVVALHPSTVEQVWMERHPQRFKRIHGVKNAWGVFKVLEPGDTLRSRGKRPN